MWNTSVYINYYLGLYLLGHFIRKIPFRSALFTAGLVYRCARIPGKPISTKRKLISSTNKFGNHDRKPMDMDLSEIKYMERSLVKCFVYLFIYSDNCLCTCYQVTWTLVKLSVWSQQNTKLNEILDIYTTRRNNFVVYLLSVEVDMIFDTSFKKCYL